MVAVIAAGAAVVVVGLVADRRRNSVRGRRRIRSRSRRRSPERGRRARRRRRWRRGRARRRPRTRGAGSRRHGVVGVVRASSCCRVVVAGSLSAGPSSRGSSAGSFPAAGSGSPVSPGAGASAIGVRLGVHRLGHHARLDDTQRLDRADGATVVASAVSEAVTAGADPSATTRAASASSAGRVRGGTVDLGLDRGGRVGGSTEDACGLVRRGRRGFGVGRGAGRGAGRRCSPRRRPRGPRRRVCRRCGRCPVSRREQVRVGDGRAGRPRGRRCHGGGVGLSGVGRRGAGASAVVPVVGGVRPLPVVSVPVRVGAGAGVGAGRAGAGACRSRCPCRSRCCRCVLPVSVRCPSGPVSGLRGRRSRRLAGSVAAPSVVVPSAGAAGSAESAGSVTTGGAAFSCGLLCRPRAGRPGRGPTCRDRRAGSAWSSW